MDTLLKMLQVTQYHKFIEKNLEGKQMKFMNKSKNAIDNFINEQLKAYHKEENVIKLEQMDVKEHIPDKNSVKIVKDYLISYQINEMQQNTICYQSDFIFDEESTLYSPYLGPYRYINDQSIYYGQYRYGKKNGRGMVQYENGDIYLGYFKNDMYNGKGRQIFKDGSFMGGVWQNGILCCEEADIITVSGSEMYSQYQGPVKMNFKQGKGKEFYFLFNYVYEGQFEQNIRQGKGIMRMQHESSNTDHLQSNIVVTKTDNNSVTNKTNYNNIFRSQTKNSIFGKNVKNTVNNQCQNDKPGIHVDKVYEDVVFDGTFKCGEFDEGQLIIKDFNEILLEFVYKGKFNKFLFHGDAHIQVKYYVYKEIKVKQIEEEPESDPKKKNKKAKKKSKKKVFVNKTIKELNEISQNVKFDNGVLIADAQLDPDIANLIYLMDLKKYAQKLAHIQKNNMNRAMHSESKNQFLYDMQVMPDRLEFDEIKDSQKLKKVEANTSIITSKKQLTQFQQDYIQKYQKQLDNVQYRVYQIPESSIKHVGQVDKSIIIKRDDNQNIYYDEKQEIMYIWQNQFQKQIKKEDDLASIIFKNTLGKRNNSTNIEFNDSCIQQQFEVTDKQDIKQFSINDKQN